MKALIVCGSGNKDGFTATMCSSVADGIRSTGAEAEIFYPLDYNLKHCTGCQVCNITGKCVQTDDDMNIVYKKFAEADTLILATPIRFSGPTSIVKMITDRFQPYWFNPQPHPKYFVTMMCGGSPEPNFKNTISIFKTFCITLDMKWSGQLLIPDTDSLQLENVIKMTFDFGKDLVDSLKE